MATPSVTRHRRRVSVRTLQRTLVPMAILLATFTAGFSIESWETSKADEVRHLRALTELGASSLDSYFLQIEGALRLTSRAITGPGGAIDPLRLEVALEHMREIYPEIARLELQFPDEHETPGVPPGAVTYAGTAVRRDRLSAMQVGRPLERAGVSNWTIPIRYGFPAPDGVARRVLAAELALAAPYHFWRQAPLAAGERLGLIRDDAFLVSLYPTPETFGPEAIYGKPRATSPLYADIVARQFRADGVVEGAGSMNGEKRIWVYRRLQHYPMTLYATIPGTVLWRTWWQQVRCSYLLLVLFAIGSYAAYRWAVRRQLAWEVTRERTQTRIRALNAALEQRVAQLEASNAELAAFSYTVSHDLRGPLRAILGFSERLESHYVQQLGERGAHYLDRIRAGAQRLGDLVDGLLHLSRLTRTRIEPQAVDLSQIAKHIVRDLRQQSPARRVHVEIDEGMTVAGSRPLLTDLVQNLLQNAWKFTSAREHAEISFSCEERSGERIYTVRDNGVGFDMQFAPKLFTVFQRLHGAEFEGTGIGLATASRILSMHGGRIWAEGEKGKGAAFHFVLAPAAGAA